VSACAPASRAAAAGARPVVGEERARVDRAGCRQAVLDLLVPDGVASQHDGARLGHLLLAALQDAPQDLEVDPVLREADDVQRRERLGPHRVEVRKGVGRGDLAEVEGVVHDGREEVAALDQGEVLPHADDARVGEGVRPDQHARIGAGREE